MTGEVEVIKVPQEPSVWCGRQPCKQTIRVMWLVLRWGGGWQKDCHMESRELNRTLHQFHAKAHPGA